MSAKTIRFDQSKCTACCACAMACMDQNDIHPEAGEELFRTVGIVEPVSQGRALGFLSLGCVCTVPTPPALQPAPPAA